MVVQNILPIGSVVQLKDIDMRVLVSGYCSVTEDKPDYTWDYAGFVFPLGYVGVDSVISFDEDQIERVITYGFQDEEQMRYIAELTEVMKDIDKGRKEA